MTDSKTFVEKHGKMKKLIVFRLRDLKRKLRVYFVSETKVERIIQRVYQKQNSFQNNNREIFSILLKIDVLKVRRSTNTTK